MMFKRIMTFFAAVVLMLSMLPKNAITAKAATEITETDFNKRMSTFRNNVYSHGATYKNDNSGTLGIECFGYANYIAKYIYGSFPCSDMSAYNKNAGWTVVYGANAVDNLHVGDIVRYGFHSIFITKIDGNTIYYTDANRQGNNIVRWDSQIYRNTLKELVAKKLSSGPSSYDGKHYTGWVAHYKNWEDEYTLSINFNANGGTIPAKQLYKVTTGSTTLQLRQSPGLSAAVLAQIPNGETIEAKATATADGYTWINTTYGGKTGWCAVSGGLATRTGYYLQSDLMYKHETAALYSQKWTYGSGKTNGLVNDTTFKIEKEGHTFVGWSRSIDGSTTVFDQDDTSLKAEDICSELKNGSQTITLYAIWKANAPASQVFYYNSNGGIGSMSSVYSEKGSAVVLPNNTFQKSGCTFMGWSFQRDDGYWYTDGKIWASEATMEAHGYTKRILAPGSTIGLTEPFVTDETDHSYTVFATWRDDSIQDIGLSAIEKKNIYYVGDTIDVSQIELTVRYKDGSYGRVTEGFSCTPMVLSTEGQQTITVTYGGLSASFTVQVTGVKTAKSNGTGKKDNKGYLLPSTSAGTIADQGVWANDAVQVLCKDGDFYLAFIPWGATSVTKENRVLLYLPTSSVTVSGTIPTAAQYYSMNPTGTYNATANTQVYVYHRTDGGSKPVKYNGVAYTTMGPVKAGERVKILYEMDGYYCIQTASYTGFAAKSAFTLDRRLCGVQCNIGSMTATAGEQIDLSVLRVNAMYSDGSTAVVTDYAITLPDTNTAGVKYAQLTYGGFATFFTVDVFNPNASAIVIENMPNTDKFVVGDQFDPTGMTLRVIYENGTEEVVTAENAKFTYDFTEPGYTMVRVEYLGVSTDAIVLVYAPPIFKAGDVTGYIGQKVSVPVICNTEENNIGIHSFAATFSYDASKLQYRGIVVSESIDTNRVVINAGTAGKIIVTYASDVQIPINGVLMELQFTALDNAEENTSHAITVEHCEMYDLSSYPLTVTEKNGSIFSLGYVKVEYDVGEGSVCPQTEQVKYGQQIFVTNAVPMRTGFNFRGWTLTAGSREIDYRAGDVMDCVNSVVLYAVWEEKMVDQWNITLEEGFKINFFLNISNSLMNTAILEVSVGQRTEEYNIGDLLQCEDGKHKLTVNISAAQMTEDVIISLINNEEIIETVTYNVVQYCEYVLSHEGYSSYHDLVRQMLNYGGAAQVHFGYNTGDLANTGVTDISTVAVPQTTEKQSVCGKADGISFYGASLVYRDRIAVRYYFNATDISAHTFTVNGKAYTPVLKDGMYYIEIADILPQNLNQQISLIVTDKNSQEMTVSYGPMNYIVRMSQTGSESLKALLKALYNYHLAASQL